MFHFFYFFFIFFFFFNDTATTEIYTLSLHDALPILSISMMTMSRSALAGSSVATVRRSDERFSSQSSLPLRSRTQNSTISAAVRIASPRFNFLRVWGLYKEPRTSCGAGYNPALLDC